MQKRCTRSARRRQIARAALPAILLLTALACSSNETKVRQAIEAHLKMKNQDIRNLALDLFHPSKNTPGKAYASTTITHNFATSSGAFQKEFLGFILTQEGRNWTVEKITGYTTDPDKAENFIAGIK